MDLQGSSRSIFNSFSNIPSTSNTNGFASNGFQRPHPPHRSSSSAAQSSSVPSVVPSEMRSGKEVKPKSKFRVLSQKFRVFDLSLEEKSFRVHTSVKVLPLVDNLTFIPMHLGKNVLLPDECPEILEKITINGYEAKYRRRDPFRNAVSPHQTRCIADLEPKIYNQLKGNDYNLEISIPEAIKRTVAKKVLLRISIDVYVKNPTKGVNFVESSKEIGSNDGLNGDEHVYTYRTPFMSGTREWLPCFDEPDQLCMWEMAFAVDPKYVAVASAELTEKQFYRSKNLMVYSMMQLMPTSACNIGWAIGKFKPEPHPESPTIHTFSLPKIEHFVKYTTTYLDKMVEFLEEKLSCRFAYPTLKIVFVDRTAEDVTAYSSLLVVSTNLLYHKRIIDVVQEVRQQLIQGIAQQFFGCFIAPSHWIDWWLMVSISKLLTSLYVETKLGLSESRWQLKRTMDEVCDYEHQWGKIVLAPNQSDPSRINLHFDPRHEYTCSPLYVDAMVKKGFLAMRMLVKRLGQEPFLRVLHRLLTVGLEMSDKNRMPVSWKHLLTSTEAFFRSVSAVTGSEIPTFVEQWIKTGGHAAFAVKFEFNRKRNMIELEVKQDDSEGNGRSQYTGPLAVVVQEVDGAFTHTIQIDGAVSHADLQCHSKGRKQKKKKIPILSGAEVDFDLSNMDAESPVLWIRLDHDMLLIREINISQPIFHWEYMMKYERDVIAQMEALERIQTFPSAHSRSLIVDALAHDKFFYRIRCRAAFVLASVQNRKSEALTGGTPVLINMFRETFGSKASPNIPKSNNFVVTSQNLQQYFVMQALPQAAARLRKQNGEWYDDVVSFILDLIKYNDNSVNRYSDDHYRACLYNSLAGCIFPADFLPMRVELPENLNQEIRQLIREFTYALNSDTVRPSFGRVVGIAALTGLYQLQKCGYLPLDSKLLWMFLNVEACTPLRRAAVTLLIDRVCNDPHSTEVRLNDAMKLIELSKTDPDPSIRMMIPRLFSQSPPFATYNNTIYGFTNSCNTEQFAERIWQAMTDRTVDSNVRSGYSDLYFSLFGLGIPPVKGGPTEAAGHHRSYVAVESPATTMTTSHWHSGAYEAARRSPPRVSNFADDSLM